MSWITLALEFVKGFGPLIVAVYVAYIAGQQWRVNRESLREKLFDRRMQVFLETQQFLSNIHQSGQVEDAEIDKFTLALQRARFLFDQGLVEKLGDIRAHALALAQHQATYKRQKMRQNPDRQAIDAAVEGQFTEVRHLSSQLPIIFKDFGCRMGFRGLD